MSVCTFLSDDSPYTTSCDGGFRFRSVSVSPRDPLESMMRVISMHSHRFALLGLTYLILVHPPEVLNSISILHHSSAIYAKDDAKQSFGKFSLEPMKDRGFKGPLITSLYALSLSALVTFGLIRVGMEFHQFHPRFQGAALGTVVMLLSPFLLVFGGVFLGFASVHRVELCLEPRDGNLSPGGEARGHCNWVDSVPQQR